MSATQGGHIVFLGPSLSSDEAQRLHPDAMILPPARVGDVVSALLNFRPHAIALIDGVFRHTMAVFHKELLEAMAQGVWVLGSSSMGALRAAECEPFGMIGVGSVFEQYRSGELEDDDEVAVAHGDHESAYRSMSDPMVNIRATLTQSLAAEILTPDEITVLIATEKSRHFSDRGFHGVLTTARTTLELSPDRLNQLRTLVREHVVDVKADDARELLSAMRALPNTPLPLTQRPSGHLSGPFITLLDRDRTVGVHDDAPVTFDAIMRYVALNRSEHNDIRRSASRRQVMLRVGQILGIEPTADELMRAHVALTARVGMPLSQWGATVDLTRTDLDRLTSDEAVIDRLERWAIQTPARVGYTRVYLDELRLAGLYPQMRGLAGEVEQVAGANPLIEGLTVQETLKEHVRRTGWNPPASWPPFMEESDLGSTEGVLERLTTFVTAWRAMGIGDEPGDEVEDSLAHNATLSDPQDRPMRSRRA